MPEVGFSDRARLISDDDWRDCEPADYAAYGRPLSRFSWLNIKTLWQSRNNVLAAITGDPTENARRAWVEAQQERLRSGGLADRLSEDFIVDRSDLDAFTFMVMGDTGEGDVSQFSVVPAFLKLAENSAFTMIASDVVYPAGDVNEYIDKFFTPYAAYPAPIYAVPGNHDWLDGLAGFMRHFCAAPPPEEKLLPPRRGRYPRIAMLLHRLLWRRAGKLDPATLSRAQALRGKATASGPAQPNMYFAIDTPSLRIIGIDAGILGRFDSDQGDWLKRVAAGPKPKLVISGKPVYSGAGVSPRRILPPEGAEAAGGDGVPLSTGTLLDLLRDAGNNIVAMVSGDIHHYERHSIDLGAGRRFEHIISGGGGAFMTSTHQIPRVDLPGVGEADFTVFPTRGDSLRAYSIILQRRLVRWWRWRRPVKGIPADQAAKIVADRHGLDGAAADAEVHVSLRSRLLAWLIFPRRSRFGSERVSEALDWDTPPFYKNLLRIDVDQEVLRISCFAVSGCRRDQDDPPMIDRVEIALGGKR